jgi:diacylglycerol kinase (ATP)
MRVAPQADPRDGKLDLVLAREVSRGALLGLLLKVYFGWHVGHPAIELVRTRRLRIASDRPLPLALDGEDGGELGPRGVEISVRPGALRLVGS